VQRASIQSPRVPRIELKLFGTPRLHIGGVDLTPGRPTVFEIIARIILEGPAGIRRGDLAYWMWPDVAPSQARANLRVNLTNLRAELANLGISDQFHIDGDNLATKGAIDVDIAIFLSRSRNTISDLKTATQPVAKGWNPERWQKEADAVAAHLADGFTVLRLQHPEGEAISLLKAAVKSHPTSTQLITLLLSELKARNQVDEASQVIIDFENNWINRFGTADLPELSLDTLSAPVKEQRKPPMVAYALPAGCLILILIGYATSQNLRQVSPATTAVLELTVTESYTKSVNGIEFGLRKFRVANTRADEIQFERLSDTDIKAGHPMMNPVLISQGDDVQPTTTDIARKSFGVSIHPGDVHTGFDARGAVNANFRPIPGFPFVSVPTVLRDGSLLVDRCCDHPFADHRRLSHYYDGAEHVVGPEGELPQIVVFTFIIDETVYGKYSYGRKEGWRYHTFSYDIRSRIFKKLNIPPVVGALDSRVLVCQPEITTILNGDYDTHPNGEVVVVDQVSGKQLRQRWANDQAPFMSFLPPYIIKPQRANSRSWSLQFLNADLRPENPFPELDENYCRIAAMSNQVLVLVPFNRDQHSREFWIITRKYPV